MIILYCIAYSVRESKSPAVSKNRKIRAKLVSEAEANVGSIGSDGWNTARERED